MPGIGTHHRRVAATRADVITLTALLSFGLLLVGLHSASGGPQLRADALSAACQANLMRLGTAVAQCRAQYNGCGPTADDGSECGPSKIMLTWADLLYDLGFINWRSYERCPADARPDEVTRQRAIEWDFRFVERFHVGETPRPGVRTSYAINSVATYNWPEDEYPDASRQVYAIDGWWTWFGCLNAAWFYWERVTGQPPPDPVSFINWQSTMVAWRHQPNDQANALFFDGSVRPITPIVPHNLYELRNHTVDTEAAFTWLPGEQNIRLDNDPYNGTHQEWLGLRPRFGEYGGWEQNPALPAELDLNYRSQHDLWVSLPNPPDRP